MPGTRLSASVVAAIVVLLFFGVGLYLRIAIPYDQVFAGDIIKFAGYDSWYHVRLIENLVHHFPRLVNFDPYTYYPYGQNVFWHPFFDWLVGGITLLCGLGSPSTHTVDIVSAYVPAVLGALTVIPVFLIGKVLFNRWAGVLAAGLIAIMPGESLGRSLLGFTDHHAAEILLSTTAFLFLILAVKSAQERQLTLSYLKNRDWAVVSRPVIYSLLSGIFLGVYLLTWVGGLLILLAIFTYFVVQFMVDHLRRQSTEYLGIVGTLLFLAALVISAPFLTRSTYSVLFTLSPIIAVVALFFLTGMSRLLVKRGLKAAYYPLTLVFLGLVALAVFYLVAPSLLKTMLEPFGFFTPSDVALTITEVHPLLFPEGDFSLSAALYNFTTGIFLSIISLGILIYLVTKQNRPDKNLLIVWSLLMLAAALDQRRYAYYFSINVALLTGYLSWVILQYFGFRSAMAEKVRETGNVTKKLKQQKKREQKTRRRVTKANMALGVVVVFVIVFYPNIGPLPQIGPWPAGAMPAVDTGRYAVFASDSWCNALDWMKDNTPDPFDDPDYYYQLYESPPPGESYEYPESAYGVMAWWDYGHMITRIAHRIPVSNPHQSGADSAAHFFTSQDESSANEICDSLGVGYVIVDNDTSTVKFHGGIVTLSGYSPEKFFEVYYQPQNGKLKGDYFFYPEYYRSLAARLYNFNGSQVIPEQTLVIQYKERVFPDGEPYKEIISLQTFPIYEAAISYIEEQGTANFRIVGRDPFVSPVPLEPLHNYELVYSSDDTVMQSAVGMVPVIKIFKYEN